MEPAGQARVAAAGVIAREADLILTRYPLS
jgi:hypothetical protein